MAPTLYFIRHGETDWNAEARLQGQRDVPLNDVGRVQAEESGRKLRDLHPRPEDLAWLASPLLRTRETAEIARTAIGLHPSFYRMDDRLKELSFGSWEGLTWKEVRKTDPVGARAREIDKWSCRPPSGESYGMLTERVRPVFDEIERDCVVVSHGGVARCLLALRCGVPSAEAPTIDIWQGKVMVVSGAEYYWV